MKCELLRRTPYAYLPTIVWALATSLCAASAAPATKAAPVDPAAQKIADLTQQVFAETSEIRHLSILQPIKSGTRNSEDIKRVYEQDEDSPRAKQQLEASNIELIKLGLAPAGFDLGPVYTNLMGEQVAGFYDHRTKTFYVTERTDPAELEVVMAHELTHALQDQHFHLNILETLPQDNSDLEMAVRSLVEGDATYTMTRYMLRRPWRALGMLKAAKDTQSPVFDSTPQAIKAMMEFPYIRGMSFVSALYQHDGWDAVSAAFVKLPRSTSQIMHPAEYMAGIEPVEVKLADASKTLGPDWRRIDYDVNGELGYLLILKQFVPDDVARDEVLGWRGDRFATYVGRHKEDVVLEQYSVWKDSTAAESFCRGYATRTQLRYERDNLGVLPEEHGAHGSIFIWNTDQGTVIMERRGADVMILEGVAERSARRFVAEFWPKSS